MRNNFLLIVAALFLMVSMTGYSRAETETTQTTTTTTQAGNSTKTVKVEHSESTEQPVKREETHVGLVGSIFAVIGNVIAFPFRVIGGVLHAIF